MQSTVEEVMQVGVQQHQAGLLREAEESYRQVLRQQPNHAHALHMLGVLARQQGQNETAVDLIRQAIAIEPRHASLHNNLGLILLEMGECSSAVEELERALQLNPRYPDAFCNLGLALFVLKHFEQSVVASKNAIELKPDMAAAHNNLGNALAGMRRFDEAIQAYRRAIELQPNYPDAYANLGKLLSQCNRFSEAIAVCQAALARNGQSPNLYMILGTALNALHDLRGAVSALRSAVLLQPDAAEFHHALGLALHHEENLDEAIGEFEEAIRLAPSNVSLHHSLGTALVSTGQVNAAIDVLKRGSELDQSDASLHSSLIYTLYFDVHRSDLRLIADEQAIWSKRHEAPILPLPIRRTNDRDPDRKLRIGYVSPDFCQHCQSLFTIPLFMHHDRSQFDVTCYSSVRRPDAMTQHIMSLANQWRDIYPLADAQAVELIRSDRIDILVDLTQHMVGNRLLVFAHKPAPVQVAWLGYPGSTGMKSMDFRLSDPYLDPPEVFDQFHSEKTIRLPDTFWCYKSLADDVAVNELPASKCGWMTFGCLNSFSKVNDDVLARFAQVLLAVPKSKLLFLTGLGRHRQRTLDVLSQFGINPERIQFHERCSLRDYLSLYHRVDISLDTLPCNGHTTTLDSLWMGVPVISQLGKTPLGRGGLSILSNLGLEQWVVATDSEYVELAKTLSSDTHKLSKIRSTLRHRMQLSPLMDAAGFARNFELACRQMWRMWCDDMN